MATRSLNMPDATKSDELFVIPGLQSKVFTPDEIRKAFDAMDVDKNDCLDASDIRRMLALTGVKANDEEIEEMIRMVDHDGTSLVSFGEFSSMLLYPDPLFRNTELIGRTSQGVPDDRSRAVLPITLDPAKQREARLAILAELNNSSSMSSSQVQLLFDRFIKADVTGTGKLSYDQFIAAIARSDCPGTQRVFQLFDADNSGSIDMREFIVGISSISDSNFDEKVKFAFKAFDSDGNGFIDRLELERIVQASRKAHGGSPEVKEVVDGFYDKMAVPRDTKLSEKKFHELASLFPYLVAPVTRDLVGQKAARNWE